MSKTQLATGITWRHPAVFAVATAVSTVLAIWAVISAPVGSVSGVSGLYLSAAIYVPLAFWFGVWGCFAGYLSCVFMGLYLGMPLPFVLVWALADFFEGFVPLLIYRSLKTKPALALHRPKVTWGLNALLAADLVVSAVALTSSLNELFIATFAASIALLVVQVAVEDHKTWTMWLLVGVLLAAVVSGVFGVGAMAAFGFGGVSWTIFPAVFTGWVLGDIIVLATLGTILTVALTPFIVKSKIYVRRFLS
jgi:hypothetical protein